MIKPVNTCMLFLFLISISSMVIAQEQKRNMIRQLKFDTNGILIITPVPGSSGNDFDFLKGKWRVKNKKLRLRLSGNNEWDEFDAVLEMNVILLGIGNRESYTATINGKKFEALALRLFNPKTKLWTDYWVDSNEGILDQHPVVGSFEGSVGTFLTQDTFRGKPILVVYQWDYTDPLHPQWRQAYSEDDGKNWEWNWYMDLTRY